MLFSFTLSEEFVGQYAERKVSWGYEDAGGNSLGEITFLRTYSRFKGDGTKEHWHEVCERVINGMFSIQKDWCRASRLPWNDHKAQRSAQDAYERMFSFKWTPPGRGLWMMGTPLVMEKKNSAALQNCGFVSTGDMTKVDPAGPFEWLMEASMLGVGVGFDGKGALKEFTVHSPEVSGGFSTYQVPDTREGWVRATGLLIESYLIPGKQWMTFDYSVVRPAGQPIKGFGGTASGPAPLIKLHERMREVLHKRVGALLTTSDIADIGNLIGACVVSGNVRRSAELLMGQLDDPDFLALKNADVNPIRNHWCNEHTPVHDCPGAGWSWMSNNSLEVRVGDDLDGIVDAIAYNGEPGVIWMDLTRRYGRLIDPPNDKDRRAQGYNPCAEQSLESYEMCTLVETYLNRHESLEDFQRTLKYAYLYAKTVTLLPTHWQRTNAIMQRNRRIGCSVSGIANFADNHNMTTLRDWLNNGYETVRYYDSVYSEWFCVRESIKTTTVKPSGTVSILAGESPGAHWAPGGEYFDRAIRFGMNDPMVPQFRAAGYRIEVDVASDDTFVCYFPVRSMAKRSENDVTIFEKANLAVIAQRYWSDNSVSVTLSFDKETEAQHVGTILNMHSGQLKTVSFLPKSSTVTYAQMPYSQISQETFDDAAMKLLRVDLSPIYAGNALDAAGESYCTTDVCLVKEETRGLQVLSA